MRSQFLILLAGLAGCDIHLDYVPSCEVPQKPAEVAEVVEIDTSTTTSIDTTGSTEDGGATDSVPVDTDTVDECPYTLVLTDGLPTGPICSGELEEVTSLEPGDLFMTEGDVNTWYFDGTGRYTIPNGTVFESWFGADVCSCEQVKVVPAGVAYDITLMGDMTIKPGAFAVKLDTSDPLYVISPSCTLHEVSEDVLAGIYGSDYADIVRPIPDVFFVDYGLGPDIETAADYDLAAASAATLDDVLAGCGS